MENIFEGIVEAVEGTVEIGRCALPSCGAPFIKRVYWQVCCSVQHGRQLRYVRRKARVSAALKAVERVEREEGYNGNG